MAKYVPIQKIKNTPLVLHGPKGDLIALGGEVIRAAKPPIRPERVIKEATAEQYKWAYNNGHTDVIEKVDDVSSIKVSKSKESTEKDATKENEE